MRAVCHLQRRRAGVRASPGPGGRLQYRNMPFGASGDFEGSSTWKTEFGSTKVAFDVSLTVIAGVLSFLFAHRLDGVREGTIIAALLVGFIARLFGRGFPFWKGLSGYFS